MSSYSAIDPAAYRHVCSQFATGVAVAAVLAADGTPHGLTVSSFTAVSLQPPLILICVDFHCTAVEHFRTSPFFAVNVLTEAQQELSTIFAAKPEGRFDGVEWTPGQTGAPLIAGALATMECRLERTLDAGDHAVVFGEVIHATVHDGSPLLYFGRSYRAFRI